MYAYTTQSHENIKKGATASDSSPNVWEYEIFVAINRLYIRLTFIHSTGIYWATTMSQAQKENPW